MIKTFREAVKYLESYIPSPDKKHPGELGLKRMKYLMNLLGNPQFKYPTIHVGGTSGKGSTATIIASILATKYKVGLHTSPHLVKVTERMKILKFCTFRTDFLGSQSHQTSPGRSNFVTPSRWPNGLLEGELRNIKVQNFNKVNISEREFIDLVNYVRPFVKKVKESKYGPPSYFEIMAAMAFLYFHMQKVDLAVIEVGMGGRYDATNVVNPIVAVLTNVGLDHTEILGDTVEKIAEDKVGIIKPGIKVVSGAKQSSVVQIIELACKKNNVALSLLTPPPRGSPSATPEVFPWLAFSYRIKKMNKQGSVFDYKGIKSLKNLRLRLLGKHQVENAALAIKTVELLNPNSLSLRGEKRRSNLYRLPRSFYSLAMTENNIRLGLHLAFIPGRLEIIKRKPLIILDGAHNTDKVKALVASIKKIFPNKKITAIIAIKNDKNVKEMLVQLLKISEKIVFTKFQVTADIGIISSYDPKELLTIAKIILQQRYTSRHTEVVRELSVAGNMEKALEEAIISAKPDDLILVTGSLYLIGEVRKFLISND